MNRIKNIAPASEPTYQYTGQLLRIALSIALGVGVVFALASAACGALVLNSVNTPVTQNFDGLGTGTSLSVLDSAGWRISVSNILPDNSNFSLGLTSLSFAQEQTFTDDPPGGAYNFRNSTLTSDRAAGFLLSNTYESARNLMLMLTNNTGQAITQLDLSFDYEKFRTGTRAFNMAFFHGANGTTWTQNAGGAQSYPADGTNAGLATPTTISKSFSLTGLNVANGSSYYLRWGLSGTGMGTISDGQAIGLDNLSITSVAVPEPATVLLLGMVGGVMGLALTARNFLARRAP